MNIIPGQITQLQSWPPNRALPIWGYLARSDMDGNDVPAVQADVSNIQYRVYQLALDVANLYIQDPSTSLLVGVQDTSTLLMGSGVFPPSVISDTVLTGTGWFQGGPGFNFVGVVDGTFMRTPGTYYLIQFTYNFTDGTAPSDDWFLIGTFNVPVN
jgi:hypothetical protein